jgi:hypothetical protein
MQPALESHAVRTLGRLGTAAVYLALTVATGQSQTPGEAFTPFGSANIPVRLRTWFTLNPSRGPVVISMVDIDATALRFTTDFGGVRSARIEVFVSIFDDRGPSVSEIVQTRRIALTPAEWQRAMRDGVSTSVISNLEKTGGYHVVAMVRDVSTDKMGSAGAEVNAPDLKNGRLVLSSLLIDEKTARGGTSALVRYFRSGDVLAYSYLVANARRDAKGVPQLQAQVLILQDGKAVYTGGVAPALLKPQTDSKNLLSGGQVTLGSGLGAGTYILQVTVTDKLAGDATVSRRAEFQVH